MENLWKICHEGRSFPKKNTWISTPFIQAGASEQWDTWTWYESEIIGITSSNYQITILEILSLLVGIFLVCIYIYIYTHYKYIHATGFIYLLHLYISLPFWSPVQHPLTHRQPVGFPLGWTPASSNRFDEELEIPQWFQIHHPQELDPRRWMVPDVDQVRSKRVASGDSYDLQ